MCPSIPPRAARPRGWQKSRGAAIGWGGARAARSRLRPRRRPCRALSHACSRRIPTHKWRSRATGCPACPCASSFCSHQSYALARVRARLMAATPSGVSAFSTTTTRARAAYT
eukprot:6931404-Prymnesium_polylepis.1